MTEVDSKAEECWEVGCTERVVGTFEVDYPPYAEDVEMELCNRHAPSEQDNEEEKR